MAQAAAVEGSADVTPRGSRSLGSTPTSFTTKLPNEPNNSFGFNQRTGDRAERRAYLFWDGVGVPKNLKKAYFWAAVASRNGRSSPRDLAASLAGSLKQALTYSGLWHAQVVAIERRATAWQPLSPAS